MSKSNQSVHGSWIRTVNILHTKIISMASLQQRRDGKLCRSEEFEPTFDCISEKNNSFDTGGL